jgi:hypothetical protein
MSIEYQKKAVVFLGVVGVDEAEGLLEWLQKKPKARVDLAACTHLHPANLQVLMAARPTVSQWPEDVSLRDWVEPVLTK